MSEWYVDKSDDWQKNLKLIKTPAFVPNEKEYIINVVLNCMENKFSVLKSETIQEVTTETSPVAKEVKIKHETIFDSAIDWQSRQELHYGFELSNNNVMHFLTTGSTFFLFK